VGAFSLWIGLSAAQTTLATPLALVFDEDLHGPVLTRPSRSAGAPASAADARNAALAPVGQIMFTSGATLTGNALTVSTDVLRLQVTGAAPGPLPPFVQGIR
jgi:hypothetical protein